ALDVWRRHYNHERPHEGIGNRMPDQLYRDSERKYVADPPQLEYPLGYLTRKVSRKGCIKLHNRLLGISVAVSGMRLGLQHVRGSEFDVWFGILKLGTLDLHSEKFTPTGGRVYALSEDNHAISSD